MQSEESMTSNDVENILSCVVSSEKDLQFKRIVMDSIFSTLQNNPSSMTELGSDIIKHYLYHWLMLGDNQSVAGSQSTSIVFYEIKRTASLTTMLLLLRDNVVDTCLSTERTVCQLVLKRRPRRYRTSVKLSHAKKASQVRLQSFNRSVRISVLNFCLFFELWKATAKKTCVIHVFGSSQIY